MPNQKEEVKSSTYFFTKSA